MNKNLLKIILIFFLAGIVFALIKFEITDYLTLSYLKKNHTELLNFYSQNRLQTIVLYFGIYILTTALSFPGATVLTLAGASIFGFWPALLIISFASTIGATIAFLAARFLFRDIIQRRFSDKLETFHKGFEKDGAFYLFTLRLVPIFPFFLINLVMGLTKIKVISYFLVSQLGMLLGTAVYVNAGVEISKIESVKGILSPSLIISFILIGILPFAMKALLKKLR